MILDPSAMAAAFRAGAIRKRAEAEALTPKTEAGEPRPTAEAIIKQRVAQTLDQIAHDIEELSK